jgi:hypothetical protein
MAITLNINGQSRSVDVPPGYRFYGCCATSSG